MKESYREGIASHPGPQPCEGGREAALEAWERGIRRQGIELRNQPFSGADGVRVAGRQHEGGRQRETALDPAESQTPGMRRNSQRETALDPAESQTPGMRRNSQRENRETPWATV